MITRLDNTKIGTIHIVKGLPEYKAVYRQEEKEGEHHPVFLEAEVGKLQGASDELLQMLAMTKLTFPGCTVVKVDKLKPAKIAECIEEPEQQQEEMF